MAVVLCVRWRFAFSGWVRGRVYCWELGMGCNGSWRESVAYGIAGRELPGILDVVWR